MHRPVLLAAVFLVALLPLAACGDGDQEGITAQASRAVAPAACTTRPGVQPGPPGPADWPVYDRTPDRHGVLPSSGARAHAAPLWGVRLDGAMFAQPLVVQGLVIEATEHDTVYAFDAATGCLAWRTSLGTPLDVARHPLDCNNIEPELGITATPAVDTTTGTVYTVAFLDPGRYEMDALDLAAGSIKWRHPIDLPDSDVLQQLSRPAVTLANGRAYASFGGRAGDCGTFHGFVVGVSADGQGPDVRFQASPNIGGAVWAPGGPVVLPDGDLLLSTGNTDETKHYDGNNAVVRLTPGLQVLDSFAPSDWVRLNRIDFDLGSVGPTLVDGGYVFQVGKAGTGYLLDGDHLGGVGGQVFQAPLRGGCYAIGATAYLAPFVYVPCDHGLTAVRVGASRFDVAWRGPDFRSGSPVVAGGMVWDLDFEGGYLWSLDPVTGRVQDKVAVGTAEHFVAPGASGGRLFAPVQGRLYAFSLR